MVVDVLNTKGEKVRTVGAGLDFQSPIVVI